MSDPDDDGSPDWTVEADEVVLDATEFTVHASEKVSTGDYENANVSMTIEGEIKGVRFGPDGPETFAPSPTHSEEERRELYQQLMDIQKDLQRLVERAGENRQRIRDHEDWDVP